MHLYVCLMCESPVPLYLTTDVFFYTFYIYYQHIIDYIYMNYPFSVNIW